MTSLRSVRRMKARFGGCSNGSPGDEDHLDDLTQETWPDACRDGTNCEAQNRIGWAKSVAWSIGLDDYRKHRRRRERLDLLEQPETDWAPHSSRWADMTDALVKAMESELTPREKEVLKAKFFSDRDTREISESLGLSESTVRVHLSNGLGKLRRPAEWRPIAMRDSYKDAETLIALERACDWRASLVLLEIANDEGCLEDLRALEWARATFPTSAQPDGITVHEDLEVGTAFSARALAAVVSTVGLLLLPGGTGGPSALFAAVAMGALVGALYPRVKRAAASPA